MSQRQRLHPIPPAAKPQKFEETKPTKTSIAKDLCDRIDNILKKKKKNRIGEKVLAHTCRSSPNCGCEDSGLHNGQVIYLTREGRPYTLKYSRGWANPTTLIVTHRGRRA